MGCTVFPATDPPANKPELPLDDDNSTSTDDTDPLRSDNGDNTRNNSDSEVTSPASDVPPTTEKKRVAMTFDDGPHNVCTQAIVDELAKYGFHATFFVVGNRVDGGTYNGGKTLPYIIEHGNEIGIHGYSHTVYYDKCDDEDYAFEISETAKAIHQRLPDYNITLLRPIGGRISAERLSASEYASILWNVDSEDWRHQYSDSSELTDAEKQERLNTIVENVMSSVKDGSIILMHDIYQSTVEATQIILQRLDEQGYEVVTVSKLLGETAPGNSYHSQK